MARVFTTEELASIPVRSLADVLRQADGITVRDYGGLSALQTISQRGMGAEHTLVLINGMRVNSFQTGLVDYGNLSLQNVNHVEVLHGGASAMYGADAAAGLINLVMHPTITQAQAGVSTSVGSFGYRRYNAFAAAPIGDHGIRFGVEQEGSEEDYPFNFRNGNQVVEVRRRNADLNTRRANVAGSIFISENISGSFLGNLSTSERGVGGPVLSPLSSSLARQTDREYLGQLGLFVKASTRWSIDGQMMVREAYGRYIDPAIMVGGRLLDSEFRNLDGRVELRNRIALSDHLKTVFGIEIGRTVATGNALAPNPARMQFGLFATAEQHYLFSSGPLADLILTPALRFDRISPSINHLSPQVGIHAGFRQWDLGFFSKIQPALRFSASRNFRAPTFNELYYNGGGGRGNPSLDPEQATSLDGGGAIQFNAVGTHRVELAFFYVPMVNRIVWVSAGGASVTPKNIRRTVSTGAELSYDATIFDGALQIGGYYTLLRTVRMSEDFPGDPNTGNQLIYVPQELGRVSLSYGMNFASSFFKRLSAGVQYRFVGYRFTSEDNKNFLPSYRLLSGAVTNRLRLDPMNVAIKVEAENLLNEEYQTMLSYPTPPRTIRFTIGLEY